MPGVKGQKKIKPKCTSSREKACCPVPGCNTKKIIMKNVWQWLLAPKVGSAYSLSPLQ